MSTRIDDLEKNIADLMTQAGVEEIEGENKVKEGEASWGTFHFYRFNYFSWKQLWMFDSKW